MALSKETQDWFALKLQADKWFSQKHHVLQTNATNGDAYAIHIREHLIAAYIDGFNAARIGETK